MALTKPNTIWSKNDKTLSKPSWSNYPCVDKALEPTYYISLIASLSLDHSLGRGILIGKSIASQLAPSFFRSINWRKNPAACVSSLAHVIF